MRLSKRWIIAIAVLAFALASCTQSTPTPIIVTATPENTPSATNTPIPTIDPTPTREHLSYQDCFTGETVTGFAHVNTNNNPCLTGEFQTVDLGTEDGRYVALYPEYWFWQVPASQNTYAYMNAGGYFFRGGTRNGMQLELVQVDGQFGIQIEQVFERGICYIIKQIGENSVPNGSLDNISLAGQIHLTDGTIVQLRNQSFPARFSGSQGHEIFWVVETSHTQIDGVISIYTEVVWANYLQGTHVTIHAIEVLDAPPEFCEGDGVVEF